jgi:hypothetical protein
MLVGNIMSPNMNLQISNPQFAIINTSNHTFYPLFVVVAYHGHTYYICNSLNINGTTKFQIYIYIY